MLTAEEPENQAPAINTLGSLFKLTEVFLWDNTVAELLETSSSSFAHNGSFANQSFHHKVTSTSSKFDSVVHDFTTTLEDMELTQQMNALGLPVSFTTNKMGTTTKKARRKGAKGNPKSGHEVNKDAGVDVTEVNNGEVVFPVNLNDKTTVSLCCTSTVVRSETSYSEIAEVAKYNHSSNGGSISMEELCVEITGVVESSAADHDIIPCDIQTSSNVELSISPIPGEDETSPDNSMHMNLSDNQLGGNRRLESPFLAYYKSEAEMLPLDVSTEEPYICDSGVSSQSSVVTDHTFNSDNCNQCGDLGNWMVFWDSFYLRNYYYNSITQESTWDPPPGDEYCEFSEGGTKTIDTVIGTAEVDMIYKLSGVEALDPSVLQDKSHLADVIITSTSNSSVQSSNETPSGSEPNVGIAISGMDGTTVDCSYQHSDESDTLTKFSEAKKNSDGEAPLHSISNDQDCSNSYGQLGTEEDWEYDLQNTSTNSKPDKLDTYEQFSKPDELISCDINTNEFSDSDSLTTTKVSKEERNIVHNKKKKARRTRTRIRKPHSDYNTELQMEGMPLEFPDDMVKYWCQRYSLFSRFDSGIKMDEEGWFSVTPESIAIHHAARCNSGIVIDSFTGVGGNAIQLAKRGNHVIAVDIDPRKIEYAQHNASIYGVDSNIDFIQGDFFQLALKIKADVVFLSPPWGGPDYLKVERYDMKTMLKPHDGWYLFTTSRKIASRMVMFLPRNVDVNQLAEIALSVEPPWALEVERNYLNGKLKAITAYFTDTASVVVAN